MRIFMRYYRQRLVVVILKQQVRATTRSDSSFHLGNKIHRRILFPSFPDCYESCRIMISEVTKLYRLHTFTIRIVIFLLNTEMSNLFNFLWNILWSNSFSFNWGTVYSRKNNNKKLINSLCIMDLLFKLNKLTEMWILKSYICVRLCVCKFFTLFEFIFWYARK